MQDVAQGVDTVVAGTIRQGQGALVEDLHETRHIAPRRAIEAVGPCRTDDHQWRGSDHRLVILVQEGDLFAHGPFVGQAIKSFQLFNRRQHHPFILSLWVKVHQNANPIRRS
ncbi:hypothetical protein D3C85_1527060 [compost metagenome]